MSPKILIYLFRSDLRLSDNPVLHAIQQHTSKPSDIYSHLLPLYVIPADRITVNGFLNPEFEGRPPYSDAMSAVGGIPRCGPHRARFLADSIWDLKESLEAIGSDLLIWPGKAVDVINAIFQHFAADGFSRGDVAGVWMSSEETTEEAQEQRDIESLVLSNGKEFRLFSDEKYFIDDRDLPFKCIQELPDSYSEFLKSVEPLRSQPRKTLPSPTTLPPLPPAEAFPPLRVEYTIPNDRESFLKTMLQPIDVQFQAFTRIDTRSIRDGLDIFTTNNSFRGGESNGLERLFHFIQSGATSSYDKARTAPVGHEFSTKLSAYLAIGCITARQIHEAMRYYEDGMAADAPHYEQQTLLQRFRDAPGFGRGENEGTKRLRQMLLWRDYFHLLARKLGNHLFALYGSSGRHTVRDGGDKKADQHEWRLITSLPNTVERCESRRIFERFVVGRTGMSFIDASQRELLLTGYTANRARQNVAYFLAKLMRLDWRLGAEWYECTLVDYDPASNWGNWQYAAGVGNDPREGRIFNPVKQAFDYDSNGEYIKKWIPELRDLKMLDAQGNGDKQMLLKLYQPCNLGLDEKTAMSLEGADFVEDPLVKIEFRIGGKPRRNNQGGRGQGRGGSTGRSWRDTVADSANGPERGGGGGGRGRGRGRGARGSRGGRGKYNAIERSNAREGSDEGRPGNVKNDWESEEETRVAETTGEVVANVGAQQQEVESTGVRRTELVIRSMASRPLSAGF